MEKISDILNNKSRAELQVIVKEIRIKGYYKMTISDLKKNILQPKNEEKLKAILELNKKFNYKKYILWMIPILLGLFYFFYSQYTSKNNNTEILEKVDKTEQYANEIDRLEKQNHTFLSKIMDKGFAVYGVKNNILVTKELIKNGLSNYKTTINFNHELNQVSLKIYYKDFSFMPNQYVFNSTSSIVFDLKESQIFSASGFNPNNNSSQGFLCQMFILLKKDYEQPVFAIGVGDCKHIDD